MIQLRCTKKVLDYIGINNNQLCEIQERDAVLGNWYLNMFNLERRKTFLFMSEKTYLSFISYGIRKDNINSLPNIFLGGLDKVLRVEEIEDKIIDKVINQCRLIEITKTHSRSFLGNLNDLMDMYKFTVRYEGGLKYCDLTKITRNINRTLQRNLDWNRPLNKTKELFEELRKTI